MPDSSEKKTTTAKARPKNALGIQLPAGESEVTGLNKTVQHFKSNMCTYTGIRRKIVVNDFNTMHLFI